MGAKRGLIVFWTVAFCGWGAPVRGQDASAPLKVMSFNVFGGNGLGAIFGPESWWNYPTIENGRRAKVFSTIEAFGPDILGLQETGISQNDDLVQHFADYGWYGIGRDDGLTSGEYSTILYREDRFDKLDQGSFWLSLTPDVPGSQYPGAGTVRIASWVKLYDHVGANSYFVLNTHLDNVSSQANNYSAQLIRQKIDELSGGLPVLLTGDLNSTEFSTAYRTLVNGLAPLDFRLVDAYRAVYPTRQANELTFHSSVTSGATNGVRIDHILASDFFEPVAATIERTSFGGMYPSDHYPVTATFAVPVAVPEASSIALIGTGVALALGWRRWNGRNRANNHLDEAGGWS